MKKWCGVRVISEINVTRNGRGEHEADTKGTHGPCSAASQLSHLWCSQTKVRILQKVVKRRVGGQGQTEWAGEAFPGPPDGPWPTQGCHTPASRAVPTHSSCRTLGAWPSLHSVRISKATCKYLIHSWRHLWRVLVALCHDLIFLLTFFFQVHASKLKSDAKNTFLP